MRHLARATLTLALLCAPLAAIAQVSQAGVTSLNGRRGPVTILPGDIPAPTVYPFMGDGSTTAFTLPSSADPTRIAVTVGGIMQGPGSFAATATTVTLAAPAPAGSVVSVVVGAIPVTVPVVPLLGSLATTRAAIPTTIFPSALNSFVAAGYASSGDAGAGCQYVRGTSAGLGAVQDANGSWWVLPPTGRLSVTCFGARGDGTTSDSAAVSAAFSACYQQGGGEVYFPPTGHDYRLATGVTTTGNTCGATGARVPNWPGPTGTKAQWTQYGSWISCEDMSNPCLQFQGSGYVDGIDFWDNQPVPSATAGTPWTPLDMPFTVAFKQNFSWIANSQFANVSRGVTYNYTAASNIGGTYSHFENIWMGAFRIGMQFTSVNDTMHCSNYHSRHLWNIGNSNVVDWMEGADGAGSGAIGWDIAYLDNMACEGAEFYKTATALSFRNGTAAYGTGTLSHAAENLQLTDFDFNQVLQAVSIDAGTTPVSAQFVNTLGQTDTDTGRAAAYFFNLASDAADVSFRSVELGYIGNNVWAIGGGTSGLLRVSGAHVGAPLPAGSGSGYGTIGGAGTHAFVLAKGSKLDLPDGTQTIQPGPNAGSVIGCGQPTNGAGSNCGSVIAVAPAATPTSP